jgi:hypothetical protein
MVTSVLRPSAPFLTFSSRLSLSTDDIRFSKWLESMRKDVECAFGILEGRFRILKTGVRVHGVEATDKIWLTCCAMHNFVLEADGLHEQWDNGVPSDWEGDLGCHSPRDVNTFLPPALSRALRPDQMSEYDTSGMGPGNDHEANMDVEPDPDLGDDPALGDKTTRIVRHLSLNYFRKKLVEHFSIRFSQNRVYSGRLASPWLNREYLHPNLHANI